MLSILNCEAESKSVGTRIVEVRKSQCGRRERRSQLLGGFAGEFRSKSYADPAFPQVNGVGAAQHPRKTTQKSGTMAISGPISCRTVQKSRNVDSCEQGGVAAHAHPLALRKCKREQGGAERRSKWMLLRPLFTKRHSHWHLRNYPDRLSGHVSIISNTRYIYNAQQSPASPAMRVIAHITVAGNHLSSRSPSFWNSRLLLTAIAAVIASRIQSGYSDRTAGAYVAICAAMISTVSTRSSSQSPDIAASAAFRPKILCRRGEQGLEACSHGHVAALRQHHRVVICFEVGEGHKDAIRLARDRHFIH